MKSGTAIILSLAMLLVSCNAGNSENREMDETTEEIVYTEQDLRNDLGITLAFPDAVRIQMNGQVSDELAEETDSGSVAFGSSDTEDSKESAETESGTISESYADTLNSGFRMKVYGQMEIYSTIESTAPKSVLPDGEIITLREIQGSSWAEVYYNNGPFMGYAKEGFMKAVDVNSEVYAELPVEYGMARTNAGDYVPAYSRLVDVRKYFNVFSSTSDLSGAADFTQYDLVVSMKLSTSETTIGEPFYNSNIALVQYDLLPMIKQAVELFAKDGYRIVIYDAYRPTSVQQRWFDVVRVHKWVADPSIGMGGVHDRGTALDISLIDMDGNLLEMPTPMHTFTEESSRHSTTMTETARKNMDYMLNVMLQCGFTYINSEWWHFQDVDTKYYLPTDHPMDEIPLVPAEPTEIGTISVP